MRSPSSLIFLVLLGVWAAYFVQYWVRRRDHLATARTVEQFTAAMRVLERREPSPGTDLSEPAPRSYAVHPARGIRPQVLVKRAEAAQPPAAGLTERVSTTAAARRATRHPRALDVPADAAEGERPAHGAAPSPTGRRTSGPAPRTRVRPSRRVRGLLFLTSLLAVAAVGTLVALGVVPVWALAPAGAAVLGAFFWVRSAVRAEAAMAQARRQRRQGRRTEPASVRVTGRVSAASASSSAAPGDIHTPGLEDLAHPLGEDAGEPAGEASSSSTGTGSLAGGSGSGADTAGAAVRDSVPELEPAGELSTQLSTSARVTSAVVAADVMVPIMDEDDLPLTWDPVPVPQPTYTLKARAERPEVEPAAVTPDPLPAVRDTPRGHPGGGHSDRGRPAEGRSDGDHADGGDGTAYEAERRAAGA